MVATAPHGAGLALKRSNIDNKQRLNGGEGGI